ncbi:MAG: T9SS type A sorting domain-containing protein [bacterium]
MRCSEIRRRINDINSDLVSDKGLQNHLSTCPKCAALVQAELDLRKSFMAAGNSDDLETIPWLIQKARVEADVDHNLQRQTKGFNIMKTISKQFTLRPKLSLSLCLGLAVLLLATVIPIKIERSIGYEVAIAGVNKDLAMDSEKIQTLLKAIGCNEASFDVGKCEVTCDLKISDLRSENDVKMVVAAFDKMGNCKIENISTVEGDACWSLLKHATTQVKLDECRIENINSICSDAQVQVMINHVISDLGDSDNSFTIWTCNTEPDADGNIAINNICVSDSIPNHFVEFCGGETPNGEEGKVITVVNGVKTEYSLDDENLEEILKAHGLDVTVDSERGKVCGGVCKMIICDTASVVCCDSSDAAAKSSTPEELPEGYSLEQNYPNPFNPTTNISFSIPSSQHVTLEVINVLGQRVKALVDEELSAGSHTYEWDAKNENGEKVTSGMYFYRLTAGDKVISKKMTLLK